MADRILRLKDVMKKTGLAKSTIYQKIKDGDFPAQIKLGKRAAGWIESEVDAWIASRIQLGMRAVG